MHRNFLPAAIIAALSATAATADVTVTFRDGAPKDRFTISTNDACGTGPLRLTIDLSTAPTGLIFDTTGRGAGVEVFQPFEWVSAPDAAEVPQVSDGDTSLALTLANVAPGMPLAFTIDLDDTTSNRQITVSGSEVAGAQVTVASDDGTSTGTFDATGTAVVKTLACRS